MGGYPALMIKQPESPLAEVAGVEQLKAGIQREQLGEVELQQARQQQQEQQTIMHLFAQNNGNIDQTIADAAATGQVRPQTLLAMKTQSVAAQTQLANLDEKKLDNLSKMHDMAANAMEAVKGVPEAQRPDEIKRQLGNLASQGVDISKLVPSITGLPDFSDKSINTLETSLKGEQWLLANEKAQREAASAPTVAQAQAKNAAEVDKATTDAKIANLQLLSMPSPEEAKSVREALLRKTQAETAEANASTQEKKAQTALLGTQPVVAFNPATQQRELTTMPQAQQKGLTNPIKVSEEDVQKDSSATKEFNVMQSSISNYKNSINRLSGMASTPESQARMAKLLSDKSFISGVGEHVVGALGGGRDIDAITELQKADDFNNLKPEEQQAVVNYFRARTAVPLVQKALTGIGRMNESVMKLDMAMIPTPIEGPSAMAKLDAFQQTIDQASQGLTKVPWLPTPSETRMAIETREHERQQIENKTKQKVLDDQTKQQTPELGQPL